MEKAKQVMMDTNIYLPIEIITNILLLLPPKVLMQLMCVCKQWKNLIKDPRFVSQYRENAASKGEDFILYMSVLDAGDLSFNLLNEKTLERDSRLRIPPLLHWKMNIVMVGSSNGVLCLAESDFFGFTIYLCNPSIWKYRTIPSSTINKWLARNVVLGFAYLSQVNDFKVLRIAYGMFRNLPCTRTNGYDICVEVYSMNTDSWKTVEVGFFPWYLFEKTSEVLVNESLHWLAMDGACTHGHGGRLIILAFDLREEAFKEIALPPESEMDSPSEHLEFVGVFRDALSVLSYCPHDFDYDQEVCELWLMKNYGKGDSWTKLYKVTFDVRIERPLKLTKREVIMVDDEQYVFVYNFVTRRTTYLGIGGPKSNFLTFTKSLALVNEISGNN